MSEYMEANPEEHEYNHYEEVQKVSRRIEKRSYDIVPVSAFTESQRASFKENTRPSSEFIKSPKLILRMIEKVSLITAEELLHPLFISSQALSITSKTANSLSIH